MKNDDTAPAPLSPEDEIAVLLPFYLSGRLDGEDRLKVERWLKTSPDAERALDNASEERNASTFFNEAIKPPAGALAKLNAQINQRGLHRAKSITLADIGEKISQVFDFGDRRLAWAAAASLFLACILQASYLVHQTNDGGYELAAGKQVAQPASKPAATVIFTPTAKMSEISEFLSSQGARIVAGPRGRGAYDIVFDDDHPSGPKNERVARFKENKSLVLLFNLK